MNSVSPQDANELESQYEAVSVELGEKYNSTRAVKGRADSLRDRARALYDNYYTKYQKLQGKWKIVHVVL